MKILVSCSVKSIEDVNLLVEKLKSLPNPFDCLFIQGENTNLALQSLYDYSWPFPIYIFSDKVTQISDSHEENSQFIWLGCKAGLKSLQNGLNIYFANNQSDLTENAMKHISKPIDFLLLLHEKEELPSKDILSHFQIKYIFATWDKEYCDHIITNEGSETFLCRYIRLSSIIRSENTVPGKWLYAMNYDPLPKDTKLPPYMKPEVTTRKATYFKEESVDHLEDNRTDPSRLKRINPNTLDNDHPAKASKSSTRRSIPPPNYVCYRCGERNSHYISDCNSSDGKTGTASKISCWFCLHDPNILKHLILCIDGDNYLALTRGGLSEDHLAIIPTNHVVSESDEWATSPDFLKWENRILGMLANPPGQISLCYYLIHPNARFHGHAHCLSFSAKESILSGKCLFDFFKKQAHTKQLGITFERPMSTSTTSSPAFWYIHIHEQRPFYVLLDPKGRYDILLLRTWLIEAFQLSMQRLDWKNCCQEISEEMNLVKKLKEKLRQLTLAEY